MNLSVQWQSFLRDEFSKEYFIHLQEFISEQYSTKEIYPPYDDIFRAFNLLTPQNTKIIIIGQDPYHGVSQANGLAFSVYRDVAIPPSLKNIYKELHDDLGCVFPSHGELSSWAKQGVLLINSILSVEAGVAFSHKNRGWEDFTDIVIKRLSLEFSHLVFILWGAPAQKKAKLIDSSRHLVLKSAHPSPLSAYRGFFGSKPFSASNEYLLKHNRSPIDWCIKE